VKLKGIILAILVIFSACIKEELSTTPVSHIPEFSLPIGELPSAFHFPPLQADSTHPGPFGYIKIDNKTYPNYQAFYTARDTLPLDFKSAITTSSNILGLTFHVVVKNSYPTEMYTQLYFLGQGGYKRDSLLRKGMARIEPATYSDDNKLIKESSELFSVELDSLQIRNLTRCKAIAVIGVVASTRPDGKTVYFTSQQKLLFDMGVRVKINLSN